jgi:putative ABC transport system permease protein
MVDFLYAGHDYFSVMDVPLAAGRVFAPERNDDVPDTRAQWESLRGRGASIVLDRAAARSLGWPDPATAVGQAIYAPGDSRYEIVGVVERAPASVRAGGTDGTAYVYGPALGRFRVVRVASDRTGEALAHINAVMSSLAPGRPLAPAFFDAYLQSAYYAFDLANRVLTGLAVFALLISGIGLFGMASYMATRRTREIGIRKVQGARPAEILRLLLWDLSRPVVWANLAAWPFVLLALDQYLGLFAERVSLTPLPFVVALAATWALACLAVASCAWRASRLHPAAALRE